MRQLSKKEKILCGAVIFLLFGFIFTELVIAPLREKLSAVEREIDGAKLLIRKYSGLEGQKDFLLKEYRSIERYLSLKGSDDEKMTAVLSKVESEAAKAGLRIIDMKPDTSFKAKSVTAIYRIQLNAEGDITKIFNFIYSLENTDILFKVDKMNLSVKDETTGALKLEAGILGISIS